MDERQNAWHVVGRGATGTALCRRDRDPNGRAVWRVRCETRRRVPNPQWHGAGPLPLGARWAGDTRDSTHLVEISVRETLVPGPWHARPSVDLVVAALAAADSTPSIAGCLPKPYEEAKER
ncbi:hypothetical protein psal_cds_1395 [Pandoravirus salinus]|uniref:Uncharacterized protein n=1 Tax=Pandoravirus salinus TaxID=1349410 RepID=S4VZL6_9VIRU|nr:hypothetical protein psal_cds_1395 [Pandoravirus salinus]AGO85818.1 hypothetical protein psal_cds_1395 [Pandoravirus salinus]